MKIFIEYEELDKRVELLIPGHYKLKKIKVKSRGFGGRLCADTAGHIVCPYG